MGLIGVLTFQLLISMTSNRWNEREFEAASVTCVNFLSSVSRSEEIHDFSGQRLELKLKLRPRDQIVSVELIPLPPQKGVPRSNYLAMVLVEPDMTPNAEEDIEKTIFLDTSPLDPPSRILAFSKRGTELSTAFDIGPTTYFGVIGKIHQWLRKRKGQPEESPAAVAYPVPPYRMAPILSLEWIKKSDTNYTLAANFERRANERVAHQAILRSKLKRDVMTTFDDEIEYDGYHPLILLEPDPASGANQTEAVIKRIEIPRSKSLPIP
jgi:hypothetical protein